MSDALMVMSDKMEFVPTPRMNEAWTTSAGTIELSFPVPWLMSVHDVEEAVRWLAIVSEKLRRLNGERLLPLRPLTPEQRDEIRIKLAERFKKCEMTAPDSPPPPPEFQRKFEEKLELSPTPPPKADGSDIKHGSYRHTDGTVRFVDRITTTPGEMVWVRFLVNGHCHNAKIADWRAWVADATFLGENA